MVRVQRVTIVLANWCPHCVPLSLNYAQRLVKDLGVPLCVLDVDVPKQEVIADKLVKEYGDYVEDYLIPQVFLEYENGRVEHLFTGYSEAISVTEEHWIDLFKSKFYEGLLKNQKEDRDSLLHFVKGHMVFDVQCRGHCDASASFRALLTKEDEVVGAYSCPSGFVSRVVYFSLKPDLDWFHRYLSDHLGKEMVQKRDLRVATRHSWDLGVNEAELEEATAGRDRQVIREVYWTRYPKTDEEKRRGVFLCLDAERCRGCGKLFVQEITSKERLCLQCRQSPTRTTS